MKFGCLLVIVLMLAGMIVVSTADVDRSAIERPVPVSKSVRLPDGTYKIIGDGWYGFKSESDLDTQSKILFSGDDAAFQKFMRQCFSEDRCTKFVDGESVHRVQMRANGHTIYRRPGETQEWWSYLDAVGGL